MEYLEDVGRSNIFSYFHIYSYIVFFYFKNKISFVCI